MLNAKFVASHWKESIMKHRKASFSGSFYPNSAKEIEKMIVQMRVSNETQTNMSDIKAMIAPHAGYIYSGYTANKAYSLVQEHNVHPRRIVVIGPSHRIYLKGASIALYDDYETPLGDISIDYEFSTMLKEQFDELSFNPLAHSEHSTETQMPFIKTYFPNTQVVEIVYGDITVDSLCDIIREIMVQSHTFIVISTDLSHFHTQEEANILDAQFLKAIETMDIEALETKCEACGITGVEALIQWAKENKLQTQVLDYRTSMNTNHDASKVVGYTSAIIGER